jgi:predicted GNAT superfamily acetyltransferase
MTLPPADPRANARRETAASAGIPHQAGRWRDVPIGDARTNGDRDAIVHGAVRSARSAAHRCGVLLREVEKPHELEDMSRMLSIVWNREASSRQITAELLRAFAKTGNYVAGAFADGQLIGASVAFFADPALASVHSHITGVATGNTSRSVGYALKLHQRAWALGREVATITWTFDPLVRRNAYFNITKLGARVVEYLPNFYGEMQDRINAGDQSDRLLVEWDLLAPDVVSVCDAGRAIPAADSGIIQTALQVADDGRPRRSGWDSQRAVFMVPQDVEVMRREAPELAREWRLVVRETLGSAMASGARVAGFRRDEGYVVDADGDADGR